MALIETNHGESWNETEIARWTEFGHTFVIVELDPPVKRGAGMRTHRLYDNGEPAYGGQWHYDEEGARSRARYVLQCDYGSRISYLENEVNVLRRQLAERETIDVQ